MIHSKTLKQNFENIFLLLNESTPNDGYFVLLRN